jgi:hypothetical protein
MNRIIYGSEEAKTLPEGLYLGLFHGRDHPADDMDDRGFDGPMIGPIEAVHTNYMSLIRVKFPSYKKMLEFFEDANNDEWAWMTIDDDCIAYEEKYYGDWSVFYHRPTPK